MKAMDEITASSRLTNEIGLHIAGVQAATQDSVASIKEIGGTIGRIAEIAAAIHPHQQRVVDLMNQTRGNHVAGTRRRRQPGERDHRKADGADSDVHDQHRLRAIGAAAQQRVPARVHERGR